MQAKEQIKFTKAAKKEVLTELAEVCHKHIAKKKLTFEEVKDVDVIATIRDAIKIIALKKQLEKHGANIKKDFCPIFEPNFQTLVLFGVCFTLFHYTQG